MKGSSALPTLHCLHGFLGRASDWETVFPQEMEVRSYDFFSPKAFKKSASFGLEEWAEYVNQKAHTTQGPRVLLGYSLGGRVALHALLQSPQIWDAAVIVSAHLGFSSEQREPSERVEERNLRIQSDHRWAERFLKEDWRKVIQDWDAQAVFQLGGAPQPFHTLRLRNESDFSREALANSFKLCSLGFQRDLRQELKNLSLPILWLSGEHDVKFQKIAEEAAGLNPLFQKEIVAYAGHRVPWDQPQAFVKKVRNFLHHEE